MSLTHPFFALKIDDQVGQLLLTPCPGTFCSGNQEVGLHDSLEQLAAAGAAALLTLMPQDEIQRNAVTAIPDICAELGVQWFHLPIEDDHAPEQEFFDAWQQTKDRIHALLASGKTIAIHCKGGTGRTGLVAAQILLERGMPLPETAARIRAVKPKALQIPAHQEYINNLAEQLAVAPSN